MLILVRCRTRNDMSWHAQARPYQAVNPANLNLAGTLSERRRKRINSTADTARSARSGIVPIGWTRVLVALSAVDWRLDYNHYILSDHELQVQFYWVTSESLACDVDVSLCYCFRDAFAHVAESMVIPAIQSSGSPRSSA